jgi:hypothetical protein
MNFFSSRWSHHGEATNTNRQKGGEKKRESDE